MTVALPPVKIVKSQYLLNDRRFDYGETMLLYKLLQQLRGNQNFWVLIQPVLEALVGATNTMLSFEGSTRPTYVKPKGTAEQQQTAVNLLPGGGCSGYC